MTKFWILPSIQPQVTETKTVTENMTRTKPIHTSGHKAAVKSHAYVRKPHKTHIVAKRVSNSHAYASPESSRLRVVETITRQSALKKRP